MVNTNNRVTIADFIMIVGVHSPLLGSQSLIAKGKGGSSQPVFSVIHEPIKKKHPVLFFSLPLFWHAHGVALLRTAWCAVRFIPTTC